MPTVSPCVCPGSPKVFLFTRSRSFYIFTGTESVWGAAACAYSPLPSRL